MGRTASLGVSWWLGLFLSGWLLPIGAAGQDAPAIHRPRIEIDDIFDAEVKRRSTRLVAPAGDPDLIRSILTTEKRRIRYLTAFDDGVQSGLTVREHGGLCGTVSDDERPALYGYSAGLGAVYELRAAVYKEMVTELAARRGKFRVGRCAAMLRQAVAEDDAAGLELLLKHGAPPDVMGDFSSTALMNAVNRQKYEVAAMLLRHGASVHRAWSPWGTSAMRAACQFEEDDALKWLSLLLEHGGDPDEMDADGTPVVFSVTSTRVLDRLVQAKVDLHAVDAGGRTALHFARFPAVVKALLAAGADVNARADDGSTPLHAAIDRAVAEALLLAGAEVNAVQADGRTPLDFAESEELRELLHRRGAHGSGASLQWQNAQDQLDDGLTDANWEGREFADAIDSFALFVSRPVYVDWHALKKAGIASDVKVNVNWTGETPGREGLLQLLAQVSPKLAFDVDSTGTILIGTAASLEPLLSSDAAWERRAIDTKRPAAHVEAWIAMDKPSDSDLYLRVNRTVRDVVEQLAIVNGVKPKIDWESLRQRGLDPTTPAQHPPRTTPLRRMVDLVLAQGGATAWTIDVSDRGEVLISGK